MQKRTLQKIGIIIGTGAVLFTSVASCFMGCGKTENDTVAGTEDSVQIVSKFDFSTINAADIISDFDYTNPTLVTVEPEGVTDADVEAELNSILASYPVYSKITDRRIQNGDSVNIDYTAKTGETIISCEAGSRIDTQNSDVLAEVTESLIGHKSGDQYEVDVKLPDDYEGTYTDEDGNEVSLAGRKAVFIITVNYIYGEAKEAGTITDSDISELTSETYDTISDFKEYLKQQLISNQESQAIQSAWESMIEACEIKEKKTKKYEELVESEYEYELGYYGQMAEAYNTDMETMAVNYGYDDLDAFKESIRADSEEIVKHYLIAYMIAQKENILLSEDEIKSAEEEMLSDYNVSSVEELESLYGETEVKLYAQLQKVDDFLKDTFQIGVHEE